MLNPDAAASRRISSRLGGNLFKTPLIGKRRRNREGNERRGVSSTLPRKKITSRGQVSLQPMICETLDGYISIVIGAGRTANLRSRIAEHEDIEDIQGRTPPKEISERSVSGLKKEARKKWADKSA